jgi:hypothetical protein
MTFTISPSTFDDGFFLTIRAPGNPTMWFPDFQSVLDYLASDDTLC